MTEAVAEEAKAVPVPALAARGLLGGTLMGMANLVPGISGGTMLLAAGVYPQFIDGVAEVTTLRFRPRSLMVLGAVGSAAGLAILLLAGQVKDLVLHQRWVMYSLFIGLTLGGVPVLWKRIGRGEARVYASAAVGFLAMVGITALQAMGVGGDAQQVGPIVMFLAGILGASAMILPGISGGYLLLVLGAYLPILSAIDAVKVALRAADVEALVGPLTQVVIPVGIGLVVGIAAVSHALKWLLARYEKPTLGVLLGLLLGAVVGLYPFQRIVEPELGTVVKGVVVTEQSLAEIDPEDWPTVWFAPSPGQVGGAVGLIGVGFFVTLGVSWVGRDK